MLLPSGERRGRGGREARGARAIICATGEGKARREALRVPVVVSVVVVEMFDSTITT